MQVVFFLSPQGDYVAKEFDSLNSLGDALNFSQSIRLAGARFVTIASEDINHVGKEGVDGIVDGKLPNGTTYEWSKAYRAGKTKRKDLIKTLKNVNNL